MAVLIESFSVVVKTKSLEHSYPGGLKQFLNTLDYIPSCYDEKLITFHFTDPEKLELFVDQMIIDSGNQLSIYDFALVDMIEGIMTHNNWLRFVRGEFFSHLSQFRNRNKNFSIAYFPDQYIIEKDIIHSIRFPIEWTPDKGVLGNDFLTQDRIESDYYFLDDENGRKLAFLKETNEQVFI
ncbi:MAG: hypothetical protein DCO96_15800 [Fluviicola sp. XM-24bin1]|nr:MAG: hypothetical protein DCO96_15800 [Fluviicola sp. XM-24bin1]